MATKKIFKGEKYINKGKTDGIALYPYMEGQYWDKENEVYVPVDLKNDSNITRLRKNNINRYYAQVNEHKYEIVFGITLLIPKDSTDAKVLEEMIERVAAENGLKKNWINPLKDGDEKIEENTNEDRDLSFYKDMYYMKFESKIKKAVKIFDLYKNELHKNWTADSDLEYNGYYTRLSSTIKPYKSGATRGIKGYLQGLQFLNESPLEIGKRNVENDFDFEEEPDVLDDNNNVPEENEVEDAM
jgi:hypothetical protein